MTFWMMLFTLLWMAYIAAAVVLAAAWARKNEDKEVNLGWAVVLGGIGSHFGIMIIAKETRSPLLVVLTMIAVITAAVVVVRRMPPPADSTPEQSDRK